MDSCLFEAEEYESLGQKPRIKAIFFYIPCNKVICIGNSLQQVVSVSLHFIIKLFNPDFFASIALYLKQLISIGFSF